MSTLSSSPSTSAKGSNSNSRRRWLSLKKSALLAAMALGALTAGQAQAVVVNVNGLDYDVTTFTGTYNDNPSKFATPANGGVMPWWGNSSLAYGLALALGSSLGYWHPINDNPDNGPDFAFRYDDTQHGHTLPGWWWNGNFNFVGSSSQRTFDNTVWAQVAPASSAAVPGPLPALGAAAAYGYSRKLRERINLSTKTGSGTDCL
jgi:hypothetical protein